MVPELLIKGRYQILRELGAGGCGCVYAATDIELEREVAVKLFGFHVQWDRSAREKFELEVKVSGRVKSKYIVQVHDAGLDPMTQMRFIVMELLNGQNMQDLVEKEQRLGPALTVKYLRQVASGLDKAHGWKDRDGQPSPIVHRDLKPSNLFLTEDEDGASLVKILDWGIAKMLSSTSTQSTDLRGTPLYMAPERFKELPITAATDIWNLGLVAFFLLTGKHYWKAGQTPNAAWPAFSQEVSEGPHVMPRERILELGLDVTLPPAFDDWFMHCAHAKPELRYPTAGEAVRALAGVFSPPVSELISGTRRLDENSSVHSDQADPRQARFKAGSSIDGGIAKNPLPSARIGRSLLHSALVGAVLGGLVVALVLAVQNGRIARGRMPSAVTHPSRAGSQSPASNSESPAPSVAPTVDPVTPTPAPTFSALPNSTRSATLPVAPLTGEPGARVNRAAPEAKQTNSVRAQIPGTPVSPRTTSTLLLAPITTNPVAKTPLDEKIRELQEREQTHHP